MIERHELSEWLREHGYALITREQAKWVEAARHGAGVVLWDEHRQALARADAEIAELRARVAVLEAAAQGVVECEDDLEDAVVALRAALAVGGCGCD